MLNTPEDLLDQIDYAAREMGYLGAKMVCTTGGEVRFEPMGPGIVARSFRLMVAEVTNSGEEGDILGKFRVEDRDREAIYRMHKMFNNRELGRRRTDFCKMLLGGSYYDSDLDRSAFLYILNAVPRCFDQVIKFHHTIRDKYKYVSRRVLYKGVLEEFLAVCDIKLQDLNPAHLQMIRTVFDSCIRVAFP